jgi:hypothetical protein
VQVVGGRFLGRQVHVEECCARESLLSNVVFLWELYVYGAATKHAVCCCLQLSFQLRVQAILMLQGSS